VAGVPGLRRARVRVIELVGACAAPKGCGSEGSSVACFAAARLAVSASNPPQRLLRARCTSDRVLSLLRCERFASSVAT